MPKDIFISYSRRDQEFVSRLAYDLNTKVAGVWFDQSTIQLGQRWHDEIMDGIRECKAFILVLSPDAAVSRYVLEEVNRALELGKTIFPILYRPAHWTGRFATLVREIQTLDLRSGSYTDNFQKLVDGLIEAGAAKAMGIRPFLRQDTKTPLTIVFSKVHGWAFAWSLGWFIHWTLILAFACIISAMRRDFDIAFLVSLLKSIVVIILSGGIGGFAGGLVAGLFTMLALRPNAPTISWRHMAPAAPIWGINGILGFVAFFVMIICSALTGLLGFEASDPDCSGRTADACSALIFGIPTGESAATVILVILVLVGMLTWFFTGIFAGLQAVHHIRRLEPGITIGQGMKVSASWGCGAIVAVIFMAFVYEIFFILLW
jgi:hypothetical protein